jgi:hypothetical protein
MKTTLMVAGLLMGGVPVAAQAASFGCRGAGQCVCTEVVSPKSVIGYNATPDQESVNVNVTCINMRTMAVAYYTIRREDSLGSYNGPMPGR